MENWKCQRPHWAVTECHLTDKSQCSTLTVSWPGVYIFEDVSLFIKVVLDRKLVYNTLSPYVRKSWKVVMILLRSTKSKALHALCDSVKLGTGLCLCWIVYPLKSLLSLRNYKQQKEWGLCINKSNINYTTCLCITLHYNYIHDTHTHRY